MYGLGYDSPDTMNFNLFFKCLDEFLSTRAMHEYFKSFLSNVGFVPRSTIRLPNPSF